MTDRRRRLRPALVGIAAVLLAGCADAAAGPVPATPTPAAAPEQYTPAVMRVMSTPHWFTGTDRRVHLVYELELTNGFPVPTTVTAARSATPPPGPSCSRCPAAR